MSLNNILGSKGTADVSAANRVRSGGSSSSRSSHHAFANPLQSDKAALADESLINRDDHVQRTNAFELTMSRLNHKSELLTGFSHNYLLSEPGERTLGALSPFFFFFLSLQPQFTPSLVLPSRELVYYLAQQKQNQPYPVVNKHISKCV